VTLTCAKVHPEENSAHEPVVKSWNRVPSPITRSASAAALLAALVPVTPMLPSAISWFQGSAPLPAWVSATGIPNSAAKPASSAVAAE
jgi:hypothetical protein